MSKGVFTTRIGSGYDDDVELHYHFPRTYLGAVEQTVGDQIVYYEPRRSDGDMSYFATATVAGIRKDPRFSDHYYADLQGYLDFDRKVPFVERKGYYESILQKQDGSTNRGAFGRSVRLLPEDEFTAIMAAGLGHFPSGPKSSCPTDSMKVTKHRSLFRSARRSFSHGRFETECSLGWYSAPMTGAVRSQACAF